MTETILHRWFLRVWTEGERKAAYDLLAPDALIHELNEWGEDARGPEQFLVFFDRFWSAMSDMKTKVEDVVTEGDRIAGRWTATGTHTGDQLGFPATGRSFRVSGMSFVRIDKNGQIAEAWNSWDRRGFMRQLGSE